jgi:hypothetical protein
MKLQGKVYQDGVATGRTLPQAASIHALLDARAEGWKAVCGMAERSQLLRGADGKGLYILCKKFTRRMLDTEDN